MPSQTLEAPAGMILGGFETEAKQAIPCSQCSKPARLRSYGHQISDCGGKGTEPPPPYYRCTDCYLDWRRRVLGKIESYGHVACKLCKRKFANPEEFSDYRRF